jgi:UDPglucose 6-dehydrogenase
VNSQTLTILGAGYVGLTTAALLAHAGYTVYAVEPNQKRLDIIKEGRSFFFETGLDTIIKSAVDNGRLIPTTSYADSIRISSVVISCVGTPDNPNGSSNLTYVFDAAKEAAHHMIPGTIYVQKSTVPVGTGKIIEDLFNSLGTSIDYVSNPEFLREGTAIADTLFFDRVVAGGNNPTAVMRILDIYRELGLHRDDIARLAGTKTTTQNGSYISTSLNSAELIKITANAFLALKISFANTIARLSDQVDADIVEVMDAVGADHRIGQAFLSAGRGYGGGCFPKDVDSLILSGSEYGVDMSIMKAAQNINISMIDYVATKLTSAMNGQIDGRRVAVLGLTFKAGTSDTRHSPGVRLANLLNKLGAVVSTYDPKVYENTINELHNNVTQTTSIKTALSGVDAVIIMTDWEDFIQCTPAAYLEAMSGKIFIDAVNGFTRNHIEDAGLLYAGIGH